MLDWFEKFIDRLLHAARFRLMVRAHPELARLETEKDRRWALWFASRDVKPWQRWLGITLVLVIGPLVMAGAVFVAARLFGALTPGNWPVFALSGGALGFIIAGWIAQVWQKRAVGTRCFQAMRIFGHDVCPACGYDMTGHHDTPTRTCPECGTTVPAPEHAKAA